MIDKITISAIKVRLYLPINRPWLITTWHSHHKIHNLRANKKKLYCYYTTIHLFENKIK